jgi:cytochrome b561/polyisoprenoid-binding protein YceI
MTDIVRESRAGRVRYSTPAIVLHWIIAAAIILQIVLANARMLGPPTPDSFAVIQLHKSVGITILLLSLARLAWRLANPPPPEPDGLAEWERVLATAVHWAFYLIMIGMPLTGWLMVSASRIAVPTLLYGVIPWPNLPVVSHLAPAAKHAWQQVGANGHEFLAYGLYGLLALHVAGALKHQLFSAHEPVLSRMAPGSVAGRWREPRLVAIALAVLAVIGFGLTVQPPRPAMSAGPAVAALPPPAEAPAEPPSAAQPFSVPTAPPPAPSDNEPRVLPVAAPAPAKPAASGPAKWVVQPGAKLGFASAWSGQPVTGRFDRWTADILFSPDALDRSKVTVSVDVGSANTGDQQRDAVLPSGDWFDAAGHPKAVFTASKFEKVGPDRYVAHGTLQLKGVSKPVDLPFRLTITGDEAQVSGTANLDRTAFNVGQGEFASTEQIPGKVAVQVALKAKRAG